MTYTEAHKEATYRYREKNKEKLREKQLEYSKKYYETHRKEKIAMVLLRREFQRLSQAASASIDATS